MSMKVMVWSSCLGVRVLWNQLSASTCSVLKNSLVKEHRITEEPFQTWMNRVFCSSGPLTSGTNTRDQQTAFKLLHFSEFFLLEGIMLLMDFCFSQHANVLFSFSRSLKSLTLFQAAWLFLSQLCYQIIAAISKETVK